MRRFLASILMLAFLAPLAAEGDDTIAFSADRMSGSSGKSRETTVLEGHASVRVGSLSISGGRIELSGKDFRYVKAIGAVKGEDTEKGFSFTADEVAYDRDTQIATLRGQARLEDTKNEVSAGASLISYNRETEVAILQVGVTLIRKKIDCTSGFALYRRTVSTLELSGEPVVKRDTDEFKASRITVDLETERITLDGAVSGTLKDAKKTESAGTGSGAGGSQAPAAPGASAGPPAAPGSTAAAPGEENPAEGATP